MAYLYIVATPIGNLKDVTLRALEVLTQADVILAEDTRVTSKLLSHYGIKNKLLSYHSKSSNKKILEITNRLEENQNIAYVSDAGTPGISDPGSKLVSEVKKNLGDKVVVEAIPGPSAVTASLSVSGLDTHRFIFYGFLPHKKGRQKLIHEISVNTYTSVLYESPYRIIKTLEAFKSLLSSARKVALMREITKKFASIYRGNINEVLYSLKNDEIKGEFVLIIEGKRTKEYEK